MQIKFEILKDDDTVLNVWEGSVAVKKKNGDVEIYRYYLGEDNLPKLSENTLLITKGEGFFSVKDDKSSVKVISF